MSLRRIRLEPPGYRWVLKPAHRKYGVADGISKVEFSTNNQVAIGPIISVGRDHLRHRAALECVGARLGLDIGRSYAVVFGMDGSDTFPDTSQGPGSRKLAPMLDLRISSGTPALLARPPASARVSDETKIGRRDSLAPPRQALEYSDRKSVV